MVEPKKEVPTINLNHNVKMESTHVFVIKVESSDTSKTKPIAWVAIVLTALGPIIGMIVGAWLASNG